MHSLSGHKEAVVLNGWPFAVAPLVLRTLCPLRTGVLILALTPRATYSTSKAFLHGL